MSSTLPSYDPREWLRLPPSGECCPVSGLTRSALNELVLCRPPLVRTCSLKEKGETRGIRLINRQSLLEYLDSKAEGPKLKAPPDPARIPTVGQPGWTASDYVRCGELMAEGFLKKLNEHCQVPANVMAMAMTAATPATP